jgi:hypothetical protein
MPHATDTDYHHIQIKKLAPTFCAEVTGVDFSKPVEKEVYDEIHRAIVDVSQPGPNTVLYMSSISGSALSYRNLNSRC